MFWPSFSRLRPSSGQGGDDLVLHSHFWRGIQNIIVDQSNAEVQLVRWHKAGGFDVFDCPYSLIAALIWAVMPRSRSAGKWTGTRELDRAIDKGVSVVKSRISGNSPELQKIREGLDRGAEKAKSVTAPD